MSREERDAQWMDEALELAARGRGQTSPNPMVGAVVVSPSGVVVGRGYHERAGEAHAEVTALRCAGPQAKGATLYCTLEPCNHTGRTGPCTAQILEAGVRRVVVGMVDPDPRVRGAGVERLRAGGIVVDVGVHESRAARLNEAFVTRVTKQRPFVSMKVALSRDGKIAARAGARTALTAGPANHLVHVWRSEVDAVGVGSGTVLVDDPRLTVRGVARTRPLTRVIFDRRLRTPMTARVFETIDAGPVVILTVEGELTRRAAEAEALTSRGARIEAVSEPTLLAALRRLAELEVTSLLLEGGAEVHRSAWREGVVDKLQRFVTPLVLGADGVPWIDDEIGGESLRECRETAHGPDVLTEAYVQRPD